MCSYECAFCVPCGEALRGVCPNWDMNGQQGCPAREGVVMRYVASQPGGAHGMWRPNPVAPTACSCRGRAVRCGPRSPGPRCPCWPRR
ncbi:DUF1272 domain-containing protein [Streptomyces sp. ALI-76-A]|uniref:DUF1272 domain-containing protein n=1 Tax=Streptomyces sp. ALI-76-A TaxID=3025736 RepID=UPI00256F3E9E|nr:DUF1272 domain-containing protein [Streptomyces sp. ALI-76-A]MDL5199927.1 DUF1272 domain-containing protein [Streptomyces sp. ALI-76-A]